MTGLPNLRTVKCLCNWQPLLYKYLVLKVPGLIICGIPVYEGFGILHLKPLKDACHRKGAPTCFQGSSPTRSSTPNPKYIRYVEFVVYVYLLNCVVYFHFLWLGREICWLTCLPRYLTLCHAHMSWLVNASPSLHCPGSTVRVPGRPRRRIV